MSDVQNLIGEYVTKARAAQQQVENYSQEQIDEVCLSVGWQLYKDDNIAECARVAVDWYSPGPVEYSARPRL